MLLVSSVALLLALASGYILADESSECPNWYHHPPGSHHCQCGPTLKGGIMCSENGVYIRVDHIMTWDTARNQTIAALSNYGYGNYSTITHRVYTLIPSDSRDLNETMCAPNNREGFLCEDCVPGYGPTAYSPKCMDCKKHSTLSASAIFLTIKLFPITIMFILLLIFRVNITKGPLFGYVLYCQVQVIAKTRLIVFHKLFLLEAHGYGRVLQISEFLSSFWATDFSLLGSHYCISGSMNKMDVLLLNFVSVLYQLLLVILTFTLIELHGRNCRPFVIMWKPFGRCFSKIRRNWSATDSIVHAYATLFLLSFATLNVNFYQLLETTNIYNSAGKVCTNVLLNMPSIHVYSSEHIYYLVIVLTLMFFLGVCPTALLCIYSMKMLRRKVSNYCSQRIQIVLNIFVETFQGTFKDGLNGTKDYRMFPAILATIIMSTTLLGSFGNSFNMYLPFYTLTLLVLLSFVIAFARPCKSFLTNLSLSFHMMWSATAGVFLMGWIGNVNISSLLLVKLFTCVVVVPHILMTSWAIYKLLHNILCVRECWFKTSTAGRQLRERVLGVQQSYESLLPDRLENSKDYRELTTSAGHAK